jgi:hypothetical protein
MANISLNGYQADVLDRYGVVVDVHHWSETHVSGSGGGISGHVVQGTGRISGSPISIRSAVSNRLRVFIKYQDGTEEARVVTEDFPMRVGHRQGKARLALYRNLDTGQQWALPGALDMPKPMIFERVLFGLAALLSASILVASLVAIGNRSIDAIFVLLAVLISITISFVVTLIYFLIFPSKRLKEITDFQKALHRAVIG